MSAFASFIKVTGEFIEALTAAETAARRAPITNIATLANAIDWDSYSSTYALNGISSDDIQTLKNAEYILARFPRK